MGVWRANNYGDGIRVAADGNDGIGKSVVMAGVEDAFEGFRVFDADAWQLEHRLKPRFEPNEGEECPDAAEDYIDPDSFDLLRVSEPTYTGIGMDVRQELIARNGRGYGALVTGQQYATDRLVSHQRLYRPVLERGKVIVESRCEAVSFVYQQLQGAPLEDLLGLEGNVHALEHPPDLLIIPLIQDAEALMERLGGREKDDNAIFENLQFQLQAKPGFESGWLREIYESRGTHVAYIDASLTPEDTRRQAHDAVQSYLATISFTPSGAAAPVIPQG